jgi:hypothetical protein
MTQAAMAYLLLIEAEAPDPGGAVPAAKPGTV